MSVPSATAIPAPEVDRSHPTGPEPRRRARWLRSTCIAPIRFIVRRPFRAALVLLAFSCLVCIIGLAVVLVLFNQHLHAARLEVEKGHNSAAMRHLAWCRSVRPEQREVLILSARVARRFGSLEEADAILATYSREYGDDEQLVLERLLYRASRGELEESTPALRMRISKEEPPRGWLAKRSRTD